MNNEETQLQAVGAELQPVHAGALESIQRAEIDMQIATAQKYPRSMQKFQSRARSMALIDEDTAASCIYSRPVGGGKFAEGLSVRAAEIVGASYGNLRVGATIIEQTPRYVKARGFAHDLETNYACATEVIESTVKKDGSPYDERMRIVIAKSCLAKARRDATFQVVPKALFKAIEMDCRKLALGEGQSISTRRARIVTWITKLAIDAKRVWTVLGIAGEADMTDEHFITLTGLKNAIGEGEVTIDEAFPPIGGAKTGGASIGRVAPKAAPEIDQPKHEPAKDEAKEPAPVATPEEEHGTIVVKVGEGTFPEGWPTDEEGLRGKLRSEVVARDVDEPFVCAQAIDAKKCAGGVTRLSRVPLAGLTWIASNLDAIVAKAGEQE